jgi:hypothetical protein
MGVPIGLFNVTLASFNQLGLWVYAIDNIIITYKKIFIQRFCFPLRRCITKINIF